MTYGAAPQYRIVTASVDWTTGIATEIAEFPVNSLQYSFSLNAPGSVSFTVPILHPKATKANLDPGKQEVHIYRNNDLVWGGYLLSVSASDDKDLQCGGEGYWNRFRRRYVDVDQIFVATDELAIVRALLTFAQSNPITNYSHMGITNFDLTNSGILRDAEYRAYERRYLAEIIEEMAAWANGFDFEIQPDKKLRLYYPSKGAIKPNIVFELGKNIGGLQYDIDSGDQATEISALGSGDGTSTCIATALASVGIRSQYGLTELAESTTDIDHFADLQDEANMMLTHHSTPRWQPQMSVFDVSPDDFPYGSFTTGDTVRVRGDYGYISLDQLFRIVSVTYQVTNEGREAITVYSDDKAAP